MALERMKHWESVSALAEESGIHRTVLYHRKNHIKAIEGGAADSLIRELRKRHCTHHPAFLSTTSPDLLFSSFELVAGRKTEKHVPL